MKGITLNNVGEDVVYQSNKGESLDGWVKIDLKASAVNHRDIWIAKGQYAHIKLPCILGSDGAGFYNGDRVMIQPGIGWGDDENYQSKDYNILGMPHNGTMADYVYVPETNVHTLPEHLSFTQGAAYGLAGLTAYRAVMVKGQCKPHSKVFITGIGGGVALCAMQIVLALGCEVSVSSSSEEKLQKATELGVTYTYNYTSDKYSGRLKKEHPKGFDLIIDSAGGAGFSELVKRSAFGARIVLYGGSAGKWSDISPQLIFWKQLSIHGSTMGSPQDFKNWLDFIVQYRLEPVIDKEYRLEDAQIAFKRVEQGNQMGKVVFNHEL